jgi:hypothetical protein
MHLCLLALLSTCLEATPRGSGQAAQRAAGPAGIWLCVASQVARGSRTRLEYAACRWLKGPGCGVIQAVLKVRHAIALHHRTNCCCCLWLSVHDSMSLTITSLLPDIWMFHYGLPSTIFEVVRSTCCAPESPDLSGAPVCFQIGRMEGWLFACHCKTKHKDCIGPYCCTGPPPKPSRACMCIFCGELWSVHRRVMSPPWHKASVLGAVMHT